MCDGCEVNQKYYRYAILEPTKEDLLLESLCIPTQAQTRKQLGSKLAEVLFENLTSEARYMLGLQPPLLGPDEVWISPNSRLKNKVRCQPIPEPQVLYQKAFTHQGILELGQNYIDSLAMKIQMEIEESLKAQMEEKEKEFNERLTEALELAKIEADENCRQVVGCLMEHFDRCFSQMVEESKLRMRKECQIKVHQERSELAAYMLVQLQEEIEKRDLELCSEFHDILKGELVSQASKFINQIDVERKVAREVLQDLVQSYERSLSDLRAEMELAAFVDVCRAINEERAKHNKDCRMEDTQTKEKFDLLFRWITELKNRNDELQRMIAEHSKTNEEYEKKMKIIMDEFQKFINFALKAEPGHAQFLLSAQKMVVKKFQDDNKFNPADLEHIRRCLADRKQSEPSKESSSVEERLYMPKDEGKKKAERAEICKEEKDSKYAFNYYKFKYNLLKNFVKGLNFTGEGTTETPPCVNRKKGKKPLEEEDAQSEKTREAAKKYKEGLILEGENAKEHLKPVGTFLQGRMKAILELCKSDPDMVRLVLGCPLSETGASKKC